MTEALLPCPFCGGTDLKSGGDDKIVGTWCLTCEATGPNEYGKFAWNRRVAPPGSRVVPEGGVDAGWQPIETAPFTFDDGRRWLTWCLLWVPDQYGGLAIVGGMNADEWLWRDDERACAGFQTAPTHWRHLPEPPALRALAEAKP